MTGQTGTKEAVWPWLVCMGGRADRVTRLDTSRGRAGHVIREDVCGGQREVSEQMGPRWGRR